jgi:hypothetical protein
MQQLALIEWSTLNEKAAVSSTSIQATGDLITIQLSFTNAITLVPDLVDMVQVIENSVMKEICENNASTMMVIIM